ncbi:unnamed protein product [Clonostachys solani]|uniref:Uncharacterized protein n=1 Tax=Clonostachys solani TaxID=160281 RepID=A0A9P0ELM7_9HYPO|nr:unnamed protein product [Clonostachys solani]
MTVLTITINNRSQDTCSYGLYAEPPTISPSTPTLTRIITRVQGVANPHGQATFILSKELIATCGIYDVDYNIPTPPDPKKKPVGTGTEVIDQQSVNLGSQSLDGTLVSGTVLEIDCSHGTPCFSKVTARATAGSGAFAIRTRTDFVPQQAASNKFFIGYSCSVRQDIGPYATFVPVPNQTYQIMPSNKFYITMGEFNTRDLVKKPQEIGTDTVLVDFDQLATDRVSIVHDANNNLTVQVPPAPPSNPGNRMMALDAMSWEESPSALYHISVTGGGAITAENDNDITDDQSTTVGSFTPTSSVA